MDSQNIRYEKHYEAQDARVTVDFITDQGQYHSSHWQNELEMIYLLNGNAQIILDGEPVNLIQGEFIVIDSNQIFELRCKEYFMQVDVHVDREFLEMRAGLPSGGKTLRRHYVCRREQLTHEKLEPYLEMCDLFKQLVPLYVNEPEGYRLKTESIVLDILYRLVQHFSVVSEPQGAEELGKDQRRIQEILSYIEEHYREPLTLEQIAGDFGLSREYFSRMFHQRLGIGFSHHLGRVRMAHFYHDLVTTDDPVMELLEFHGITNYKLFSRVFREIYGRTPREIRKMVR